ncbi:MAG: divalent metal cation transporter [Cyclobacteriaceae bacterium]
MNNFLSKLGPGILFASTCIGVSHLVQSTRAGALFGFELVLFVILANLFKYPFFEYGTRFAAATGKSILVGYFNEARWMLLLFLIISFGTMFTVTAGVTIVAAGTLGNLISSDLSIPILAAITMIACFGVLFRGKYSTLETVIKFVAGLLVISTIVATILALTGIEAPKVKLLNIELLLEDSSFIFIVALMGWMPSALDLAAMNSAWTVQKAKIDQSITFKNLISDFNIGYLITALLALCFLTMGATLLYDQGVELSNNSVLFAGQLTGMFTKTFGDWMFFVIAIAAFSTMFSTTLTVLDGYPRVVEESINLLTGKSYYIYKPIMIVVMLIGWIIIVYFSNKLGALIDLATVLSFVVAPIIAIINYKVVTGKQVLAEHQPKPWLKNLSYAGILFLVGFTIIYLTTRF